MSGCGKGRGNGTLYRCKLKNSNNELKFISIMRWFNKNELIRCYRQDKAQRCKECRLPQPATRLPNGIEESLTALVEDVLDPVREKLGRPIVVNSGFRCPVHNRAVGGATGSQHVKGEAADITLVQGSGCRVNDLAKAIVANGTWDQLILYPTFVHVSYKRGGGNRREILRKTSGGYVKMSINDLK